MGGVREKHEHEHDSTPVRSDSSVDLFSDAQSGSNADQAAKASAARDARNLNPDGAEVLVGGKDGAPKDATGAKEFSDVEKAWIEEVLSDQYIRLFFDTYGDVPPVVLHRVATINRASGTFFSAEGKVGLSDRIYEDGIRDEHELANGESITETDEESFKGTLIHEIFHYMEHHVTEMAERLPADVARPDHLIEALRYPEKLGLDPYAFGWFAHPDSGAWLHFDIPEVSVIGGFSIFGDSELMAIKDSGDYEGSPMPVSGNRISAEEDMSETVAMYLASGRTRAALASEFPLRFALMERFFKHLLPNANR